MSTITYKVVKRDDGWAYEGNGTYSKPFPTRDSARKAAILPASEQASPGETTKISVEDKKGRWHTEAGSGIERIKFARLNEYPPNNGGYGQIRILWCKTF